MVAGGVLRSASPVAVRQLPDPATELIFTKPQNSYEAARVALPQTAVAIVLQRFAVAGLEFLEPLHVAGIREPGHGDCTQWSGPRDSLVQRLSFGMRLTCGWTVAATVA